MQRFQENGATVFYISHALIASVFMYTSISSSPCCYVHGDGDDVYQKGLYFGHGKRTSPHTDNMCNAKINLNIDLSKHRIRPTITRLLQGLNLRNHDTKSHLMKLLKILQQRVCELLLAGAGQTLIGAHSTTPNPLVLSADQAW